MCVYIYIYIYMICLKYKLFNIVFCLNLILEIIILSQLFNFLVTGIFGIIYFNKTDFIKFFFFFDEI